MSNSNLFLKSGFVRAPLQNGVGRFVPQLQRIVLKFCKSHGGSRGMRLRANKISLMTIELYVSLEKLFKTKLVPQFNFSYTMRDFIEQDLVDFAKDNSNVVVYLKPRRHRSAVVVVEYLNGDRVWMSMHNKTHSEVTKWIETLRTQQGDLSSTRLRKYQYTDYPSIQGPWTPFIHKNPELNVATLPNEKFGANNRLPVSATEKLRELFEKQKIAEKDIKQAE